MTLFSAAGLEKYEQGLADFQAKCPKIKVKLRVEADNNYNTGLPRLLASDWTPDIVQPYVGGVRAVCSSSTSYSWNVGCEPAN